MPASNSFWSWLLSLFRRSSPPVAAPVTPPIPTRPPLGVPILAPVTPVVAPVPSDTAAAIEELRDVPPVSVAPPPPVLVSPPVLVPQGDRGSPPQSLPTEGPNLGFRTLWNNHPTVENGETFPCRDAAGTPNFGNQCAILMGTCLLRSNLLQGYDRDTCWYRGHKGHTLRARELSDWMRRHPERFGSVEVRRNVTWGAFKGRTGFVCFHNFWGVGNQGDHIDLWDGTGILMREKNPGWEGPALADGAFDYFERSEEVWFWPVH